MMSDSYEANTFVRQYIQDHITTSWKVYWDCVQDIIDASNLISTAFKNGNKLLLCGNGGSAADCQHLAGEFVPMGLPAIALTTDTSVLTAISNDREFASTFRQEVRTLGKEGDVLLGITTSGKSPNILAALRTARWCNLSSIALTGGNGLVTDFQPPEVTIKVPSTNTQHIQEAHIMIEHLIWLLVKEALNA